MMGEPRNTERASRTKSQPSSKPQTRKKAGPSKITQLEKKVKKMKASLSELKDRHLRLGAEFDNYRKRKEREIGLLLRYEGEDTIKTMLPVVDDLERMVQSANGEDDSNLDSLIEGMNLIYEKLTKRLRDLQVEPFESVGKAFDPELHDAIMTEQSEDHDEHEITQEFEKGYRFKDKVIRHAKVKVVVND